VSHVQCEHQIESPGTLMRTRQKNVCALLFIKVFLMH